MVELTRRRVLRAVGIAGVAALAGCTDGTGNRMATDSPTRTATPNPTMTDDPDTDEEQRLTDVETTIHQTARALDRSWEREQRPGICALFRAAGEAEALVEDADEETRSFVDDTEFESSVLVYVESIGPTGCYDEIEFSELGLDDDAVLRGNAAAVDTSDRMTACQDVITYAGALVRVDAKVRSAELRVFDGWGQTAIVGSDERDTANSLRRVGGDKR